MFLNRHYAGQLKAERKWRVAVYSGKLLIIPQEIAAISETRSGVVCSWYV